MLMEIMGLHLPGASFVNPGTPLRDALTREAAKRALSLTAEGNDYTPVGHVVSEKTIVNGLVGLHATGGSTNHTHAPDRHRRRGGSAGHLAGHGRSQRGRAAARARLSQWRGRRKPFPRRRWNGVPDPRAARNAEDVKTVWGGGLSSYTVEATLLDDKLGFTPVASESGNPKVLAPVKDAFSTSGGLKLLTGNLGRSVIKVSAVKPEHRGHRGAGARASTASRDCRPPSRRASSTTISSRSSVSPGPRPSACPSCTI